MGSLPCLSAGTPKANRVKRGQVLQYQRIVGLFLLFLIRGKRQKKTLLDVVQ